MHAAATRAFTRAMAVISACIIYPCWSIARRLMSQLYYALGVSVRDFMVLLRLWGVQGWGDALNRCGRRKFGVKVPYLVIKGVNNYTTHG